MRLLGVFFFLILIFTSPLQASQLGEEVDYLDVASELIKAQDYARALTTLKKIKVKMVEEPARYYALMGLSLLGLNKPAESLQYLDKSLAQDPEQEEMHFHRSQAQFLVKEYDLALKGLLKIQKWGQKKSSYTVLLSDVYRARGEKQRAWSLLSAKVASLTSQDSQASMILEQKRLAFLIEEKLFQSAYTLCAQLLSYDLSLPALLGWSQKLGEQEPLLGLKLLEMIRLQYPHSLEVNLTLAQAYLNQKKKSVAAQLLEEASRENPQLAQWASQLMLRESSSYRIPFVALTIPDARERLRQEVSVLLKGEEFSKIAQLDGRLKSGGLLGDDEMKYLLSYSYFKTGQYSQSKKLLMKISEKGLVTKSLQLREEIEKCENQLWRCYEHL